MGVAKSQENIGNIVVSVIPLTVEQYKERFDFETLPESLKSIVEETDPAEGNHILTSISSYMILYTFVMQPVTSAVRYTI